jgi:predicted nucleotidyltransferase
MPKPSKEKKILYLFFNEPSKHWHFKEIKEKTSISDDRLNHWLKKFQEQKLIKKVKEKGRMPHYQGNHEAPEYINTKKLFGLNKLHETGLLNNLSRLKAETIIIFGSLATGDWHKNSDIDIFIYGECETPLEKTTEKNRETQYFHAKNRKELEKYSEGLIKNIASGYLIKGSLDFLKIRAK